MAHDEGDDVAAIAAGETLEDVQLLVDVHRGMLVIVIPAYGTAGVLACAMERDAEMGADIEDGKRAELF